MTDTIKINGEDYPITINMNVLAAISKKCNLKMSDIFRINDVMDFGDVLYFIWAAVKEGCRIEKREFNLTIEDVGAGTDMKTLGEFVQVFTDSQAPAEAVDDKKKESQETQ